MRPLVVMPLYLLTALAEIGGCYMVFLSTRRGHSPILLAGATLSLALFAWLLSFHPSAGRAYAAYGGVYIASAVLWGWLVEERVPDHWDLLGAALCLAGTAVIAFGPRR